ncbi:flippase [Pontibacter mangrovi]|uniref:flippase n=1 Tax=Pontibacter mangrovi TaxID=2589816 RepID=UPI0015E46CFD|nr:flippase [Pontibacter mangrovi]
MIHTIKQTIKKRGVVLQNITSLFLFQGINYLSPILTLPYLIATLGAEKYGFIAFSQAITQYLIVFTEYGFNLTATKKISVNRANPKVISRIFSSVLIIKAALITISLLSLITAINIIEQLNQLQEILLYYFGMVVGQALFPIWLFQGMEKMKYITIVNVVSKGIFIILVFFLVKAPEDYKLVPLITSAGFVSAGLFSLIIAHKEFKVSFSWPGVKEIMIHLREGWHIFISSLAISLYRNTNLVILGFMSSGLVVGYFSIAEKITKLVQSLINPVSQALYPSFSLKLAKENNSAATKTLLHITKLYFIGLLALTAIFFALAPLAGYFIDEINERVILNIKILSPIILFGSLNYLIGVVGLVNLGYEKYFSSTVMISGAVNIALCCILVYILQDIGAAIALSLAEFTLFCLVVYKLRALSQNKNERSSGNSYL